MVVKTHSKGRGVTGLLVSSQNVERYFPQNTPFIELQLDHLKIACVLAPEFWQGHPEIHDPRLCAWLETKYPAGNTRGCSVPLALIPLGQNCFRLRAVAAPAPAHLTLEPRSAA
jgi:hypothetical protein